MHGSRRGRPLVLVLTAVALLATTASAGAATLSPHARHRAMVALVPRDPGELAAYARAVATPGSVRYRQYLTVAQFRRRFAPTAVQRARVRAALRARGLQPGQVTANGLAIPVTGATATRPLSGPAGRLVQGIVGSDDAVPRSSVIILPARRGRGPARADARDRARRPADASPGAGPQPCAGAASTAAQSGAHTADAIASAYGLQNFYAAGDEGRGVTVALYELEPFSAADVAGYQSCYGTSTGVTVVPVAGGAGAGAGSGEAAMDVENVIGLAPQANVRVYEGPPTGFGAYGTYSRIVSDDAAQVVSTSWGLCEPLEGSVSAAAESTLFQEAAVQGQSFVAAAGDLGSDDCADHQRAVDDPASQPWVTAVGGTSLGAAGDAVWNDALGATGGGASQLWARPSYQGAAAQPQSAVRCASSGFTCREVPDISADGDPETGYVADYAGAWRTVGGTSVSAPTVAALTALAEASGACAGHPLGLLNPALYSAPAADFHDVTSGSNAFHRVAGFSAGPGYDMASGLGTPAAGLGPALCRDAVTLSTLAAQSWVAGRSTSLQITASSAVGARITYAATGLPPGMALDRSSGRITGVPRSVGRFTVTVTVADADAATAAGSFAAIVTSAPAAGTGPSSGGGGSSAVRLSRIGARSGHVGAHVRFRVRARDLGGLALRFRAAGLPRGLTIARRTGLISGTPRAAGDRLVRLRVADGGGDTATVAFRWTIAGRPRAAVGAARLAGSGRARLSLRLTGGRFAPAIRRAVVVAPPGSLRFLAGQSASVGASVAVVGPAGRRLRITVRVADVRRGRRAVRRPATLALSSVRVALRGAVAARFRDHSVVLRITVTDTTGARTSLRVRV